MEPLQYMLYRIEQNIQSLITALSQGGGIQWIFVIFPSKPADGDGCGSGRTDAGGFSFLPKVLYFGIDGRRGKGLISLDNNIRKGCNV